MTAAKLLTNQYLIASDAFGKLIPAKQTEILAGANGKPVVFVNNFAELKNKKKLTTRLLAGEDVAMELEFNGIVLTEVEQAALEAVKPVLERIGAIGPNYPWVEPTETEIATIKTILHYREGSVTRAGYTITVKQAKNIWNRASAIWSGARQAVKSSHTISVDGYTRTTTYTERHVTLGCQTINRYEVEAIAQHYGWEPVTSLETA
jgi:hypothetical protein